MIWKKLFLLLLLFSNCKGAHPISSSNQKSTDMSYVSTFQLKPCAKIKLEYFEKLSDERDSAAAKKTKELTDAKVIGEIFELLTSLPDKGDMMVKMGDVPFLRASLIYADRTEYFTFFNKSIKTPATSFYSSRPPEEKKLYDLLQSLLS
jgi:hypothetical protein